jgi:hypothetical protein
MSLQSVYLAISAYAAVAIAPFWTSTSNATAARCCIWGSEINPIHETDFV